MRRKPKIPQFEFGYKNEPFALVGERETKPEPKPETKPEPKEQGFFAGGFNECECGGAFDGFAVTSDADPGL